MPKLELAGWMVVAFAAAVLVLFVAVEAIRYAFRVRVVVRAERSVQDERPAPPLADARATEAGIAVPAGARSFPQHPPGGPPQPGGVPPASALDGRA